MVRINEAGRAALDDDVPAAIPLLLLLLLLFVDADVRDDDDDDGFGGGLFSLIYSISIGASCLMDTRLSVFALPECLRIESRRDIIGELEPAPALGAIDDDVEGKNLSIESRRDKFGELPADGQTLGGRNAKSVLSRK